MYNHRALKLSLLAVTGSLLALAAQPVSLRAQETLLTPDARRAIDSVRAETIREHVRFLSDDKLEGRDTASSGGQLAADYLAGQFQEMGLKPVGDNGTFFQKVPFQRVRMDTASSQILLKDDSGETRLAFGEDFVLNGAGRASAKVSGGLVFAGYGITAPEFQHDDYKGLDVKGKVVVILAGEPVSADPAFFDGEKDTRYASGGSKIQRATANGAVAVITLLTGPRAAAFPWDQFRRAAEFSSITLPGSTPNGFPALVAREQGAEKLFAGSELSWKAVTEAAAAGKVQPQPLKRTAAVDLLLERTPAPAPNVVGLLEGRDPELKKQVVVYTAHYDHIGARAAGEGDLINNGAWDNASGTSGVLETARAFTRLEQKPRRSILFMLVTGEEKGLLGSRYYTQNPIWRIEDTAANINLDMTEIFGIPKEIVPQGAERSPALTRSAQAVADALNLKVGKDPTPELNVYTRSDQFSFVQAGVPSIFLRWANEYEDLDAEKAKELVREKMRTIYHNPKDEFDPTWSWEGMRRHTQQAVLLGLHIANEMQMPGWNEADPFNKPRGAQPRPN